MHNRAGLLAAVAVPSMATRTELVIDTMAALDLGGAPGSGLAHRSDQERHQERCLGGQLFGPGARPVLPQSTRQDRDLLGGQCSTGFPTKAGHGGSRYASADDLPEVVWGRQGHVKRIAHRRPGAESAGVTVTPRAIRRV